MSKRAVTVCDGCGDYGPDVTTVPVTVAGRGYDNCASCSNKVERIAAATLIPTEPAAIPQAAKLELEPTEGNSPPPFTPPTAPPAGAVPLSPLFPSKV